MSRVIAVIGSGAVCNKFLAELVQTAVTRVHSRSFKCEEEGARWEGEAKLADGKPVPVTVVHLTDADKLPSYHADVVVAEAINVVSTKRQVYMGSKAILHMPCDCGQSRMVALTSNFREATSLAGDLLAAQVRLEVDLNLPKATCWLLR